MLKNIYYMKQRDSDDQLELALACIARTSLAMALALAGTDLESINAV